MTHAILVTGSSSGIGLAITQHLAGLGHTVYATVRKPHDHERLAQIDNVHPLMLDVCDSEQIAAARATIEAQGTGLYGLVNNAGVGPLGFLHTFTDHELQHVFEVNVYGPVRLTNALLDLLLAAKGRVVNVGSQGGSISMAYYGPYTMTKHALEAYTVALHEELSPHGVRVSIVQPGYVETDIYDKGLSGNVVRFQRAAPPFERAAKKMLDALSNRFDYDPDKPESANNRKSSPPKAVSDAVCDALFAKNSKQRYLVGSRWEGDRVVNALIERLHDANACPSLGYTHDELVAKLSASRRSQ